MNRCCEILVVDSKPDSRAFVRELLEAHGYRVRLAGNAESALASLTDVPPDLILLEARMEGMSGFELCRRIKANPATRDVPVVFLTAPQATEDQIEGFRVGAADFVSKPFRRAELLARVQIHTECERHLCLARTLPRQGALIGKRESLGVLAAGIAHDFNNLLSTIFAEADLAVAELPGGCPARENIERIGAVALRAAEIVQMLLVYAGQGQVATKQPVSLSSCVREILQLLEASLPQSASVETVLDFHMPAIDANAPQVRHLILNLLRNAVEALPEGRGVITIESGPFTVKSPVSKDWGEDLPCGEYGRLVVSDTGKGMNAKIRSRLFDPYYSTKFIGRGLGLAVVRGIVSSHGGAIRVFSSRNGSTFEVLLPCVRRSEWRDDRAESAAAR